MKYRLGSLMGQYHLENDDERVAFLQEAAKLIASLPSPVEREVYGARAAEAAGVTPDAMKLEVGKAYKRRISAQRRAEEKRSLEPAAAQQPRARGIHYDNVRSAMAEEGILRMVLREESLLGELSDLPPEMFSSPLLGRAYAAMLEQHSRGGLCGLPALEGQFTEEEIQHLAAVAQKGDGPVREEALEDYKRIVREEYEKREARQDRDLMALRDRLKEKKGLDG